jgi:hypothetical protein
MALNNREKRRQAIIQDRRRILIEKSVERRLKAEFKRMAHQVGVDYRNGGLDRAIAGTELHTENIRLILEQLYIRCGKSSQSYLVNFFGKSLNLDLEKKDSFFDQPDVEDTFDLAAVELMRVFRRQAFNQSKLIANTSREGLRFATAGLVEAGESEVVIGKLISGVLDKKNINRAQTIARTETGMALMESQYAIVDDMELPPMLKEWNATIDGRTRKTHRAVDGDKVKKDGMFKVGSDNMRFPQDRLNGSAKEIINCRCVLTWEPEDF